MLVSLLLVVVAVVVDVRAVVFADIVQAAFVETHLHDLPVVAHPGGKINTKVAWRELSQVVFLVNGSRYGTVWCYGTVRFGKVYGTVRDGTIRCMGHYGMVRWYGTVCPGGVYWHYYGMV